KVKNYIETEIKRLGFEQYVTQVVIPMEKVIQIRNGKKVPKERPYYPGYLMIEAELMGEIPHVIKNIPGVISFLSLTKGGDPVPMRKSEVNRMLGRMDELSEFASEVDIPYVVGENVKVIDGPFNGFNGTVEKILEDKKKIEVSVLIFGRKTPMELSYMQVEKV
ncbi:transcription termination/antitermination protein NusG, partial [Chryseobacterium sp.]|uniref:transcription termination/antitermination protein NusG n=1 Tax=Chryseobacterium sp. TaxID=1871047 RepID=UPI0024E1DC70